MDIQLPVMDGYAATRYESEADRAAQLEQTVLGHR
jgi:CheY-like chemotaxis protein